MCEISNKSFVNLIFENSGCLQTRCGLGIDYVENLEMLMMIHSALLDRMMTMMMMILIMIVMTLTAYPVLCLARRGVKMVITAVAVIPQRKTRFPPYLHF